MKRAVRAERIDIAGPAGTLEGLLEVPEDARAIVALVCHPHPQQRGTMSNKVVHTLARCFYRAGAAALRFNFRGVGASQGRYDDGAGEVEDALAAASWARAARPDSALFLAGFSFGAAVALLAASPLKPIGLITVAPPVARIPQGFSPPACPWLIVHGEQDEIVPLDDVREWIAGIDSPPSLTVIGGATHFFHGALGELSETAGAFFRRTAGAYRPAAGASGNGASAADGAFRC
jgi:uncharacterized protein